MNSGKKVVREAVLNYLEKRKYTESDILKNGNLDFAQSPIQLITQSLFNNDVSQNNSVIFSCTTRNIAQINNELNRLKSWIFGIEDNALKEELKQILFPLFFHLYLDALSDTGAKNDDAIINLFTPYQQMFLSSFDCYKEILTELASLQTINDLELFPHAKNFRSRKYVLRLSPATLSSFVGYLTNQCEDPIILLNILKTWFTIEDLPETGPLSQQNSIDNDLITNQLLSLPDDDEEGKILYDMLDELCDEEDIEELISVCDESVSDDDDKNHDLVRMDEKQLATDNVEEDANNVRYNNESCRLREQTSTSEFIDDDRYSDGTDVKQSRHPVGEYSGRKCAQSLHPNDGSVADVLKMTQCLDLPAAVNPVFVCKLRHCNNVCCGSLSESMDLIATGCMDSKIQLWHISDDSSVYDVRYRDNRANDDVSMCEDNRCGLRPKSSPDLDINVDDNAFQIKLPNVKLPVQMMDVEEIMPDYRAEFSKTIDDNDDTASRPPLVNMRTNETDMSQDGAAISADTMSSRTTNDHLNNIVHLSNIKQEYEYQDDSISAFDNCPPHDSVLNSAYKHHAHIKLENEQYDGDTIKLEKDSINLEHETVDSATVKTETNDAEDDNAHNREISENNHEITAHRNHVLTMRGHQGPVTAVKIIKNLHILVSVSQDSTMRVWDLSTYTCRAIYVGHNGAIWCLDVSILNAYIATGSRDKTALLWTFDRTYPIRIFAGHLDAVTAVRFHPNAVYLATASSDHTIRLFTVADGNTVRLLVGHSCPIYSLVFSPDGCLLTSGGNSKRVIVWELASAEKYVVVDLDRKDVTSLNWASDSKILAITFLKNSIMFYFIRERTGKRPKALLIATLNNDHYTFICSEFSRRNTLSCIVRL